MSEYQFVKPDDSDDSNDSDVSIQSPGSDITEEDSTIIGTKQTEIKESHIRIDEARNQENLDQDYNKMYQTIPDFSVENPSFKKKYDSQSSKPIDESPSDSEINNEPDDSKSISSSNNGKNSNNKPPSPDILKEDPSKLDLNFTGIDDQLKHPNQVLKKSINEEVKENNDLQRKPHRLSGSVKEKSPQDSSDHFFKLLQDQSKNIKLSLCEKLCFKGNKEFQKDFKCFLYCSSKILDGKILEFNHFPEYIQDERIKRKLTAILTELSSTKYSILSFYHLRYLIFSFPAMLQENIFLLKSENISKSTQDSITFINQFKSSLITQEKLVVQNFKSFIVYLNSNLKNQEINLSESNLEKLFPQLLYHEAL